MGLWLVFAIPGIVLTTLTGWVFFGKGKNARAVRRKAQRARRKVWTGTKTRYRSTRNYYRAKRAATPRGQLKAKRKAQPHRWTYGNVRTADDPTRSRRAARYAGTKAKHVGTGLLGKARDRYRLRKANAAPKTKPSARELLATKMSGIAHGSAPAAASSSAHGPKCLAPTQDGSPCQNTCMDLGGGVYAGSCWIPKHKAHSAQTGEAQSKADAKAARDAQSKADSSASAGLESWIQTTAAKPPAAPKPPKLTPAPKPPKPPAAPKPSRMDHTQPIAPPPAVAPLPTAKSTTNVASSGFTPVQVGQQSPSHGVDPEYDAHIAKVGRRVTPKPQASAPPTPSTSTNYAAPGASVGQQSGTVVGNVNVTMSGRRTVTDRTVNRHAGSVFQETGKGDKAPKPPKAPKTPNSADVDQSTETTTVHGRRITTDGTMNIQRGDD